VVGGLLADLVTWRAGFLVNLPIGVAMLVAGRRVLPETERAPGRLDLPGALLATLGPAMVVYGVVNAGESGWGTPASLVALATGAALLVALVSVERTVAEPVLVLGLFADKERVGAYLARALFLGGMMSFFLLTSQFVQDDWAWSPLAAGLGYFPMTLVNFAVAMAGPRLQRRVPGAVLMVAGLGVTALGLAGLGFVTPASSYLAGMVIPMILVGAGQGLAFGPLTASGLARVAPAMAGAASGVVNSVHQLGGSLGLSLVLAVSASYPTAMRASSALLSAALVVAAVLVLPAARRQRAG